MKPFSQSLKSIIPPMICAGIFSLASWILFFITGPTPDMAAAQRLEKLRLLQKQDRERLNSYNWVDRAKGWVRIPIKRAMEMEERRLRAVSPHSVRSSPGSSVLLVETPP